MVRYRPSGSPLVKERFVKSTSSHVILRNLKPNTNYKWVIRTVCSDRVSDWVKGPDFTTTSGTSFASGDALRSDINVTPKITMQIMPNPSNGNFIAQMQLPPKPAYTVLSLYDNIGTRVWEQNAGMVSGLINMNISLENKLTKGVYIFIIRHGDKKITQKIVVTN